MELMRFDPKPTMDLTWYTIFSSPFIVPYWVRITCFANKVTVNIVMQDEKEFLKHILKCTNMKSALEGECGFLATNLYAKNVFGEDALVNISIEKQVDDKLSGYIRIRSKTQEIALSLRDKITLKQKGGA